MASDSVSKFVLQSISKLYLKSELADVNFLVKRSDDDDEAQKVPAHKNILAAASPVFNAMFFGDLKENKVVEIADASVDGFKEFLQFFYLSEVNLTMENTEEVARLADKYDVLDCLNNYAMGLIGKLTMDNMCWGYQLAVAIKHEPLKLFCEKNIGAFPEDLFKSNTFPHCNQTVLKHILELDTMMCDETDVFEACIAWAKFACRQNGIDEYDSNNLKKQLGECFYLIRFGAMTIEQFVAHTVAYEELFTRDELVNILYKGMGKFDPNLFSDVHRSKVAYHWDNKQMLICSQGTSTGISMYHIQNPESVWFSTNVPVVLGEIYCFSLRNSNTDFTVIIIEIDAKSFDVSAPTRIIYTGTVRFLGEVNIKIPLKRPLIINPKKMYEIRLVCATNTSNYYYNYNEPWKFEFKLDNDFELKFHRNPTTQDRRGLVSCLCFNRF